jgi:hypothetical protein
MKQYERLEWKIFLTIQELHEDIRVEDQDVQLAD